MALKVFILFSCNINLIRGTDVLRDELLSRRDYVLETLGSIPKHFITLYSSRKSQCKLGYESSSSCDSYQLGEMIRFLSRKGLLGIESSFAASLTEESEPYSGKIEEIIAKFRECSSYQIDENHRHCGLRTRLMPLLETIRPRDQVGICLDCWKGNRSEESWSENPQGGKWDFVMKMSVYGTCQAHRDAKAMYTAAARDWTPSS